METKETLRLRMRAMLRRGGATPCFYGVRDCLVIDFGQPKRGAAFGNG